MNESAKHIYEFGPFRLDTEEYRLLREDEAVPLPPKAFDTLLVLIQHRGHVLSKDELMKTVWPDTIVEEANLSMMISTLRKALGESVEQKYIETIPKRGYRFVAPVSEVGGEGAALILHERTQARLVVEEEKIEDRESRTEDRRVGDVRASSRFHLRFSILGLALLTLAALVIAAALFFYFHRAPALTETDTILLADFVNTTGDPAFDGTLNQGLAVHLGQTPFLNFFPDERVREALRLMGRSADERLTREVARELCQRQGLKAMIVGSIARLGSRYVLTLEAVNAQIGEVMAREQTEAAAKEQVLRSLGQAASALRQKLGESLRSIQEFDIQLEQATTASLEALKAYSLGAEKVARGGTSNPFRFLSAPPSWIRISPSPTAHCRFSTTLLGNQRWRLRRRRKPLLCASG